MFDKFINIASQHNSGVDVTINLRQDLGSWGTVNLTSDMAWQTRDEVILLDASQPESDNGEAGSPDWVGDFRLNWQTPDPNLTVFYSVNVIGGTSNEEDFLEDNGQEPCINSVNDRGTADPSDDIPIYGLYCPDLTTPTVFYHNASISYEFMDGLTLTAGVSNIFDRRPPRVSVFNGAQVSMLGPVVAASQYGFVGRRAFINVTADF